MCTISAPYWTTVPVTKFVWYMHPTCVHWQTQLSFDRLFKVTAVCTVLLIHRHHAPETRSVWPTLRVKTARNRSACALENGYSDDSVLGLHIFFAFHISTSKVTSFSEVGYHMWFLFSTQNCRSIIPFILAVNVNLTSDTVNYLAILHSTVHCMLLYNFLINYSVGQSQNYIYVRLKTDSSQFSLAHITRN